MNAEREYYRQNSGQYTQGSSARQLNAAPDIRREGPVTQPRRREKTAPKEKGMDFKSLLVLTIAIISTLYICVQYLQTHSDMSSLDKTIISMENDLSTLSKVNTSKLEAIYNGVDLEYVYQRAVGELGMVYPNKNEIISYEKNEEDFVRQYKNIPQPEKNGFFESVIFIK